MSIRSFDPRAAVGLLAATGAVAAALLTTSAATSAPEPPSVQNKVESVFSRVLEAKPAAADQAKALVDDTGGRVKADAGSHEVFRSAKSVGAVAFDEGTTCLSLTEGLGPGTGCANNDALVDGQTPLWQAIGYADHVSLLIVVPNGFDSVSLEETGELPLSKAGAVHVDVKSPPKSLTMKKADGSVVTVPLMS